VVSSATGNPGLSSVRYPDLDAVSEELRPLARVLSRQMLYNDAPDHSRLRGLISKAFSPRAVETLRARILEAVDRIIDEAAPTGRMDIVADLARPLPLTIICDLLDVPQEDRPALTAWSEPIAEAIGNSRLDADRNREASQSMADMLAYFRELLTRQNPAGPDSLRALVTAQAENTDQDPDELLANCALLLIAGHETTTHFIGNATLALLRHPHAAEQLRKRPDLMPAAVEELLRYDAPVQLMLRRARHDLDLAGRTIAEGQTVLLVCGAANRDPAVFPDPHVLDFERPGGRHMSFGHGPHFCLGAALARLEGDDRPGGAPHPPPRPASRRHRAAEVAAQPQLPRPHPPGRRLHPAVGRRQRHARPRRPTVPRAPSTTRPTRRASAPSARSPETPRTRDPAERSALVTKSRLDATTPRARSRGEWRGCGRRGS
jgi:cytochrome P450